MSFEKSIKLRTVSKNKSAEIAKSQNAAAKDFAVTFELLCYTVCMIIKSLAVSNFRNHDKTFINLSPGVNVFLGKNAQGKTNLLEAVYLTCVGRGWRTNKDKDMINFHADLCTVKTVAVKRFGEVSVEVYVPRSGKKAIKINNIPVQKMGELMGQVNCVFFSPDELRLIKDAPADRRRFLDIDISQVDKTYFYSLLKYNKILLQRNTLLKSKTEDIKSGLNIWDTQLAKAGALIVSRRIDYINKLKPYVEKVHKHLSEGKERISLSYINITSQSDKSMDTVSEEEMEKLIMRQLFEAREKDMRLKTTTVGPHRDDLQICLNDKDVRYFASQGQQRTAALSLKLGELEVFESITGEMPVLLLDDVFSELDSERQLLLIGMLDKCQSIITTTHGVIDCAKFFKVEKGKVL